MTAERISILSVNIGLPAVIGTAHGEEVLSGIVKRPVSASGVFVRALGIDGDGQADLDVHGGLEKAVYAYPSDHWPWWESEKHLRCAPNTFGENLTLAGVDESDVGIGDRFRWGEVLLEISQPRSPCFKLAIHTKRPDVPQLMTLSARSGWYLRVVEEGTAPVHGATLIRELAGGGPNVRETFIAAHHPGASLDTLRRIHDAPALSVSWRNSFAKKIAALPGRI
jgi:MOSC domain-containing protein YiiM